MPGFLFSFSELGNNSVSWGSCCAYRDVGDRFFQFGRPSMKLQCWQQYRKTFYVKSNGNRCWTSPTWAEVQFRSSWSPTRRSRVGLQLDRNWTSLELHEVIHHRLQSSPSRPNWSPTRRSRVWLQLGRDGLDWSCTRFTECNLTEIELHFLIL